MNIESHVAGIPCVIQIDYVHVTKGNYSRQAETPSEYYGESTVEFTVLDRKGYPAPWLEKKLTDADINRIETEILEIENDDY